MNTAQMIETLKGDERYFEAGALAAAMGHSRAYGCHYGMRSTRNGAETEFQQGFDQAEAAINAQARA